MSLVPSILRASVRSGLAAGAALALVLAIGGCDRQSQSAAQPEQSATPKPAGGETAGTVDRSRRGARMPELSFKDPAGHQLRLSTLTGTPLLVNLWATWCAPCVAELPQLDALATRPARLRVVTVSEDLTGPDKVAAFLKLKAPRLEPWLDPDNDASVQFQVQSLPTTIYYDARGREVWRLTGGHDWTGATTTALLAEAGK